MPRHDARVDWKHLVVPGLALLAVVIVGAIAIWSFIAGRLLVTEPEPLPKVTVVTVDPRSRLAAAWVRLLTHAEMSPTLVPLETFDPIEGVVVFCDIPEIPPRLADLLVEFVNRGGALAFVGTPPATTIGRFHLSADAGLSDSTFKLGENASPVLARLHPGWSQPVRRSPVALLKESPRMIVDARWATNSRAVAMHIEIEGARYLWFGLDPDALLGDDTQLMVLLRTAFRWVAGQPVSDGAVGPAQSAKTLTPDARRKARQNGFAFSVDRSPNPRMLTVRMVNGGGIPLPNPTVKVWMPPRVTKVALAGDVFMTRNATLTGVPEEGACLISLPSLTRNEDRVFKLEIVERRPAVSLSPRQRVARSAG
jgi:hypothetical protein